MSEMEEKVRQAVAAQIAMKEHFIARYLDATGAKIEDIMLVEQRVAALDGRGTIETHWWCEPKQPLKLSDELELRDAVWREQLKAANALHDELVDALKSLSDTCCGEDYPALQKAKTVLSKCGFVSVEVKI